MKLIDTIYVPQESVNDDFLSLVNVHVKTGDFVKKDAIIAELETSKAIVDVRAQFDSYIVVHVSANTDVKIGSKMFEFYDEPIVIDALPKDSIVEAPQSHTEAVVAVDNVSFSNAAKEYIAKNKVNPKEYEGLSFVTTKDLIPKQTAVSAQPQVAVDVVKETNLTEKEFKPLSPSKKKEFEFLSSVNSSSVISRLSIVIEIGKKENIALSQNFIDSTPLPTVIQEVSKLLLKYPNLNSFYYNGQQAFYKNIHLGFAIDDGTNGLKVAAIFNSDKLSLNSIEETISDLSLKYSSQKLTLQELTSTTFTITDLFGSNIISFHPLVNSNNACILGISSYRNGEFIIDLSFDHRLTSGKEVSSFLDDLKYRIETRFNLNASNESKSTSKEDIQCIKCLRDINDDINGQLYFSKVVNSKHEGYICEHCLNGW